VVTPQVVVIDELGEALLELIWQVPNGGLVVVPLLTFVGDWLTATGPSAQPTPIAFGQ